MTTHTEPTIRSYVLGRMPEGLFDAAPDVVVDREEIAILGPIPLPDRAQGATDEEHAALVDGRVAEFRERTRQQRIGIARELERRFDRKVAWGVLVGERRVLFTHLSVPVMTRLRQPERQVLDTLVESGVARSRADALAWCVRLVGRNSEEWLGRLREAMTHVEKVRAEGPGSSM